MAKTDNRNRLVLRLDPRIALEAIILNRLEQTPRSRKQEWLRGMLVQGFRLECQVLREVPDTTRPSNSMSFSAWVSKDASRQAFMRRPGAKVVPRPTPRQVQQMPAMEETPRKTSTGSKPFSALGKVIG